MEKRKYFVVRGNFENQYKLFYTMDTGYYPENPNYCKKFTTKDFFGRISKCGTYYTRTSAPACKD